VCFSFYANKNLSTADGGAIALMDSAVAERLRRLRMSGMNTDAWSRYIKPSSALEHGLSELGYKMNYTDLQAAIGRVQLKRFAEMQNRRFEIALRYRELFSKTELSLKFQKDVFGENHSRHLFVVLFPDLGRGMARNQLLLALHARNVGAAIHYMPLHKMPFYQQYVDGRLPVTERLDRQILTLPISAKMSLSDVDYAVGQLVDLFENSIHDKA
jgi:dTDP-4-amino-4,6-dideoxygalactose transaminase